MFKKYQKYTVKLQDSLIYIVDNKTDMLVKAIETESVYTAEDEFKKVCKLVESKENK